MEPNEKQQDLIKRLKAAGFAGGWWGFEGKLYRVCLESGRRDAKVYLHFDDPDECDGCRLEITLDVVGQPPAWYRSEKRKIGQRFAPAFLAALEVGDPAAAERFRREWAETPEHLRAAAVSDGDDADEG